MISKKENNWSINKRTIDDYLFFTHHFFKHCCGNIIFQLYIRLMGGHSPMPFLGYATIHNDPISIRNEKNIKKTQTLINGDQKYTTIRMLIC